MKNIALAMRPKTLDDFFGQTHIIGEKAPLRASIKNKNLPHCFFFGPPGSGKTTLSRIIGDLLQMDFIEFNATNFKTEALRNTLKEAQNKPLIFIDEVHRLNKAQQESLLPVMEENLATIMGSSTQNPYYSLTQAIRSRSFVFEFLQLNQDDMNAILDKALSLFPCQIDQNAREYLIQSSNGDVRAMLNLLDISSATTPISLEVLKSIRPHSNTISASSSDDHYNIISALIKSIRGSDENASIYYLGLLIDGGENPDFIARRLVILASEDIGNANPNALNMAVNTLNAVSKIGYPESRIILAQCVIYLASSPKSNTAYDAINKALEAIGGGEILSIPKNILPNSKSYVYPHDFGGWVKQKYLEKPLSFVKHTQIGFEKTLKEWLDKIKGKI